MKERNVARRPPRGDRLIREMEHDPYKTRLKLSEPTACPQCGAVFLKARWQWTERPDGAEETLCQACHRTNDNYPAGILSLGGEFLKAHRTEILNLARNVEESEKRDHALHRIMSIEESKDGVVINTTDIHLPRRIGEALAKAYEGDLDYHYDKGSYFLRATWQRDD